LLSLVSARGSVGVSAAAEHLGVARSTAHRMLATLQYEGFVRQDPLSKAYGAGPKLLEIGLGAVRSLDVRAAARPALEELSGETGETAHVVILDGTHILFVDSVESTRAVRVGSRVGMTMPAHCTAAGKVILARAPEHEIEAYLDALPAGMTEHSLAGRDAVRAELTQVAQQGWAANFEESEDGLSAVAVAIDEPSGAVRTSITLSLPASRLPRQRAPELAEAVTRCAQLVSARLMRGKALSEK
jgi:DNA-binding IclR family transcriptional regulator